MTPRVRVTSQIASATVQMRFSLVAAVGTTATMSLSWGTCHGILPVKDPSWSDRVSVRYGSTCNGKTNMIKTNLVGFQHELFGSTCNGKTHMSKTNLVGFQHELFDRIIGLPELTSWYDPVLKPNSSPAGSSISELPRFKIHKDPNVVKATFRPGSLAMVAHPSCLRVMWQTLNKGLGSLKNNK